MTKLTLNKPLSLETQEKLLKIKILSEKNAKMSDQEKAESANAKELFSKTKAWLESTYPKTFNFKQPQPLKIGIHQELLLVPSPYSKRQINRCLGVYCSTKAYLEAITQGDWRYGLNGEKVEGISQEHKDHAIKQLVERKNKFKTKQMRPHKGGHNRAKKEESQQGEGSRGQSPSH